MEKDILINLPKQIEYVLTALEQAGFESYLVGGCVRDMFLRQVPKDYDIATNALPNEIINVFLDKKQIHTGLKHGTVGIVLENQLVEVTTYRIDGEYVDFRRPESVSFSKNIEDDLSRRDFTINSIAYNNKTGVLDFFSGVDDLKNGIIRCVGDPEKRFSEDALRILRGLRFAARLGFEIESRTSKLMLEKRLLLKNIAAERILSELFEIMTSKYTERILNDYRDIFAVFIPELEITFEYDQKNPHHDKDLWRHTISSVGFAPKDFELRMALLLHDLGKPFVRTFDEDGIAHYYSHFTKSTEIALEILTRLRFSKESIKRILFLVQNHHMEVTDNSKRMRKLLSKYSEKEIRDLIEMKNCDALACRTDSEEEVFRYTKSVLNTLEMVIKEHDFLKREELAINGKDLLSAGFNSSPQMGKILSRLHELVVAEKLENVKDVLLNWVKENYSSFS